MEELLVGQKYYTDEDNKSYSYVTPGGFLLSKKDGKHRAINFPYKLVGFDCESMAEYVFEEVDWQQNTADEWNEYTWVIDRVDITSAIESALGDILDW